MKLFWKLFGTAGLLALLILLSFIVWGEPLEARYNLETTVEKFQEAKSYAWAIAIALLIGDILLPIPGTVVYSALGAVYGLALGTLIGTVGSIIAGLIAYGLARIVGKTVIQRIAQPGEIEQAERGFNRWGGLLVIASRSFPILPEVISMMAGLTHMRLNLFTGALTLGALPTALLFSWIGVHTTEAPLSGLILSALIPLVLWGVARRIISHKQPSA